jgi:predicted DNA-binding protein
MVTLDMPKEIEAQFAAAAQARGVPLSDYVRDFIVEHYQEDADDLRTACERLPISCARKRPEGH